VKASIAPKSANAPLRGLVLRTCVRECYNCVYVDGRWRTRCRCRRRGRRDLDNRHASALGEDLVEIRRQIDRLEAQFVRRLALFQRQRGFVADGSTSAVSWLRSRCGLAAGGAAGRAEVARELPSLPEADRLFRAGEIGLDHALVLARTVAEVGAEAAGARSLALVERAQCEDPTQLREASRRLRYSVDPEGATSAYRRMHERRHLNVSKNFDGLFILDGVLDPEGGATLRTAMDALCAPAPGDTRNPGQRRADAIVELAHRQLQAGNLPMTAGQRPHLVLTVSADSLRGDPNAPAADLGGAGPVPNATARRIACDAALSVVTLGASGETLDVGRTRRTAPAALRRALSLRDKHCIFSDCDRPPDWSDAHHVQEVAHGGATRLDNMVLLCRYHHTFVHERGWRVERRSDGSFTVRPP
jgi:Domain of unknown function (DUF222)/HNH endonuclease